MWANMKETNGCLKIIFFLFFWAVKGNPRWLQIFLHLILRTWRATHTSIFRMEVLHFELILNCELGNSLCYIHSFAPWKISLRVCARHINKGPPTLAVASWCPIDNSEKLGCSSLHFRNTSRVTPFISSFLREVHDLLVYIPSVFYGLNPFYIQSAKQSSQI